jgi:integrase
MPADDAGAVMAHIRQRGKRWQALIRRRGVNESRTFDTKGAAERWARRREADADEGARTGKAPGTVGDLLDRYERELRQLGKPIGRTKAATLNVLRRHLGELPLRRLDSHAVRELAKARRAEGAGPVTVGIDLSYLATVLRTAKALLGLPVSPEPVMEAREALRQVGAIGKPRHRERRPTGPELAAVLAHVDKRTHVTIPMATIIRFALASGMRCGEITRLRWADLDPGRRVVMVRSRKDPRRKDQNDVLVPLLDVTGEDALRLILAQARTGERIFPYDERSVSAAFTRACKSLEIEDLHFHDLRAEFASRALEAGMSIDDVALCTGHREWRTLQRYARTRPEDVPIRFPARSASATPVSPLAGRSRRSRP